MSRLILVGILFVLTCVGLQQDVWGAEERIQRRNVIESINIRRGKKVLTIRGTSYEVSPLSPISDAWTEGQNVRLSQNNQDLYYSIKITNRENGETVVARKINGQIPGF